MSSTWATIAGSASERPICTATEQEIGVEAGTKYAVLDASAVIAGYTLQGCADKLFTTPEVYAEIQDKQSKQLLATLPSGVSLQEPTEESISAVRERQVSSCAVTRFARVIGETHSLSRADLHLIALAHSLHTAQHGKFSLHQEPAAARAVSRGKAGTRVMPGWGATGGRWQDMDKMEEAERSQMEGLSSDSRVAAEIQELTLRTEPEQPSTPSQQQEIGISVSFPESGKSPGMISMSKGTSVLTASGEGNEDEEDQWETAAVSQNAARRRRRKQARQAKYAASFMSEQMPDFPRDTLPGVAAAPGKQESQTDLAEEDSQHNGHGTSHESQAGEGLEEASGLTTEDESTGDCGEGTFGDAQGSHEPNLVSIVTGDFAMQNVILQIGLQLVSPDGRQISRISRWALRCSACFKVTKDVERIFCPTCGNAALQKVEVVIGEGGAEQFGVRKRHIIRGTRFSLPKPKGGKASNDPILREDVMMQRLSRRKQKSVSADPFIPEYNSNTWHVTNGASNGPAMHKGVAAVLASWKHNPNERRMPRTNRRK